MTDWGTASPRNPLRRGWSARIGRLRLRSVPWYWDVLRERLTESSARRRPVAPPPVHHDHYCQECDRRWVHEGHTCPAPWASACPQRSHQGGGSGQPRPSRWLIVVRRDRAELCSRLRESFEDDQHVTVVLDRRQSDRRGPGSRRVPVVRDRRRWKDRRLPPSGEDRAMWANLGFRVQQDASPRPRPLLPPASTR